MKPTWQTLHKIRKLNVYKAASWAVVLVPIFASMHLAIRQHLHLNLPIPTDLFFTYLSTILFFASSLLIDLYCPNEVKDHGDFEAFFQFVTHKIETIANARREFSSRHEALLHEIAKQSLPGDGNNAPFGSRLSTLLESLFSEEADKAFLAEATTAWMKADEKWPIIRWIAATGFALSAAAAAYISFYDAPRRVLMALV